MNKHKDRSIAAGIMSLLRGVARDIGSCWRTLALAGITYKLIALVILTPTLGILFRVGIALSGRPVLTDEDILYFLMKPVGWTCVIVVGALFLAIVAWEQATLIIILREASQGKQLSVRDALKVAATHAWSVLFVTGRIVAWTLLVVAPFAAVIGLLYVAFLTEFDINYYLAQKPPVFWGTVAAGSLLAVTLLVILMTLYSGWILSLPLVALEGVTPRHALRVSQQRTSGQRQLLLVCLALWLLGTTVLSAAVTGAIVQLGQEILVRIVGSLGWLAFMVGALLVLWSAGCLAVNLLSTITLAAMLCRIYRQTGGVTTGGTPRFAETVPAGFAWTRTRVLAAAALGVIVALSVGIVATETLSVHDQTEITAHRGSSATAPENTLAAVEQAIADQADWVEIDVQETADGEVVVFHDSDFQKLAGRNLKIWEATMADLQTIDIGSHFSPAFAAERVPTLGQVLDLCRGRIKVNIELKYYGHHQQLEQRVADLVERHRMENQIVLMSLDQDGAARMKSLRPRWKVGLLTAVAAGDLSLVDADFLAVNANLATWSLLRAVHRRGKEVHVWTINDPLTMSNMMTRGVDNLITDNPALAQSVARQRRELTTTERILVALAGMFDLIEPSDDP